MWQSKWPSHEMGGDEGARRLEQFRIRAKDFNVHTDGRDDDRLDGARDVTHGHMTNGSARGQEDCVDAVSFEYLRLRVDLLPPLYLLKSSGKVVLERSELGKSCLRNYATSFAEGTKFARDIFCQKRQKMRVTSFVRDAHI